MIRTCIVIADAGAARFYDIEETGSPRHNMKLVERTVLTNDVDLKSHGESVTGRVRTETNTNRDAGPVHPIVAQRERHRVELERRFSAEIVRCTGECTKGWKQGTVILVAGPQSLGLLREPMRKSLHEGIELKELAKDYAHLSVADLQDHLALNRLIPAR